MKDNEQTVDEYSESGTGVEVVDEVVALSLGPHETLQSYGYDRNDILDTKDISYTSPDGRRTQELLRVWVLNETEVLS